MDADGSGTLQLDSFQSWWSKHPRERTLLFGVPARAAAQTTTDLDLVSRRQQQQRVHGAKVPTFSAEASVAHHHCSGWGKLRVLVGADGAHPINSPLTYITS
jgi:hypothetical protein|eukprot:SAG25_NODE_594_length_6680_cov_64.843489_3_plen_102_part_00